MSPRFLVPSSPSILLEDVFLNITVLLAISAGTSDQTHQYVGERPFRFIWPPADLPEKETLLCILKEVHFWKSGVIWCSRFGVHYPGPQALSSLCVAPSARPSPRRIWGVQISQGPQHPSPAPVVFHPEEFICEFSVCWHLRNNSFVLYWCFFKLLICMYFHNWWDKSGESRRMSSQRPGLLLMIIL